MEFILDDKELREVYCDTLIELAEKDERIVVLEADLMKSTGTRRFKERYPDRTFNVGVAEANMAGIAAGLATCGKVPFMASFTPFATRRIHDQITISHAYSNLHTVIVGTDPGITAELNGGTHMSVEDIAIMRAIPNMKVVEIVDSAQLKKALPVIVDTEGPVYMRLFRRKAVKVYDDNCTFELGKGVVLRDGDDVAIIASGIMVAEALQAADELSVEGINCAVINIHTIKPLDDALILKYAEKCGAIVTAENASVIGGLGGAVAELLVKNEPVPVEMVGIMDCFGIVGRLDYLKRRFGLCADNICKAVKNVILRKK